MGDTKPIIPNETVASFYRFPAFKGLKNYSQLTQSEKVVEEAEELKEAVCAGGTYYEADFEAMDYIHAAECYLRMRGHDEETLERLRQLVITKNQRRGYYGVME